MSTLKIYTQGVKKNWEERKFFWTIVSLFLNCCKDSFHTSIHLFYILPYPQPTHSHPLTPASFYPTLIQISHP